MVLKKLSQECFVQVGLKKMVKGGWGEAGVRGRSDRLQNKKGYGNGGVGGKWMPADVQTDGNHLILDQLGGKSARL